MRAYKLTGTAESDMLQLHDDLAMPQPGYDEVVVRVHAVSLNYRDLMMASGNYGSGAAPGVIPASDGAGEVTAVGEGVEDVAVGDRVAGAFFLDWVTGPVTGTVVQRALGGSVDGMLAEYVQLPARACLPFPDHMSYEEAATMPCAALTAWNALAVVADLRAGETVLLQGTGGVSIFALQLAKLMGATVIQTSSSDEKLKRVAAMGADHTINYKNTPEWQDEALRLTGGHGVDVVVEVGGYGTLERSLQAIRVGGTVTTIGLVSGIGEINPLPLIMRAIRLNGIFVGSHQMFADMTRAMTAHELKPVIDKVFPFDQAPAAYAHLKSGAHFGKVVIKLT